MFIDSTKMLNLSKHYKEVIFKLIKFTGGTCMDNNKNRMKDRPKSNAEMRKMYSEAGSEIGIEHGKKISSHSNGKKYTKRSKLSHNK